jgi:hypothetical protein
LVLREAITVSISLWKGERIVELDVLKEEIESRKLILPQSEPTWSLSNILDPPGPKLV